MRLFESRTKKEKKTLLVELLDIIDADGIIAEQEENLFIETAKKLGFSKSIFLFLTLFLINFLKNK